jgi:pectin methylesterase-like acyl-CoA thioesterase
MMRRLTCVLVLTCVSAFAAPKKIVTVAADGSGDFKDVQAAVDSAPNGGVVIRIKPGIYKQLLNIASPGVELRGLGAKPDDVVLTFNLSHGTAGGSTTKSASTTISGDDFYAENLTFDNSFSRDHPEIHADAQAVALLTLGDRQVFRHVRLIGAQDTLYANSKTCHSGQEIAAAQPCRAARQFFSDCYIEGHVDFLFGDAKAVFDHCEIHAIAHQVVTLTAQSRVYPAEDSGYLFLHCSVTGDPGAPNVLLGRPWRAYSTVYFVDTDFKAKLNPAGWAEWDGKLKTSTYGEFGSHGDSGDVKDRIAGARIVTAAEAAKLTVKDWLSGTDGWNPTQLK